MTAIRIFILLLVSVIPVTGGFYGIYMMKSVFALSMSAEERAADPVLRIGDLILDNLQEVARDRKRERTFDPVAITVDRVVELTRTVAFEALLKPGETAPATELRELYAEARASRHFRPHCAELLETLASRCAVLTTVAVPRDDGSFAITATIGYAPAPKPALVRPEGAKPFELTGEMERELRHLPFGQNHPGSDAGGAGGDTPPSRRGLRGAAPEEWQLHRQLAADLRDPAPGRPDRRAGRGPAGLAGAAVLTGPLPPRSAGRYAAPPDGRGG